MHKSEDTLLGNKRCTAVTAVAIPNTSTNGNLYKLLLKNRVYISYLKIKCFHNKRTYNPTITAETHLLYKMQNDYYSQLTCAMSCLFMIIHVA